MTNSQGNNTSTASEIVRLAFALSLSERFHLYVVALESTLSSSSLAKALNAELHQLNEPRQLELLDPYLTDPSPVPITREELRTRVLGPLQSAANQQVVVVSAVSAVDSDLAVWRWAFQRLNEHRDSIASQKIRGLILALPAELVATLRTFAPDLWSVKSGYILLPAEDERDSIAHRERWQRLTAERERSIGRALESLGSELQNAQESQQILRLFHTLAALLNELSRTGASRETATVAYALAEQAHSRIENLAIPRDELAISLNVLGVSARFAMAQHDWNIAANFAATEVSIVEGLVTTRGIEEVAQNYWLFDAHQRYAEVLYAVGREREALGAIDRGIGLCSVAAVHPFMVHAQWALASKRQTKVKILLFQGFVKLALLEAREMLSAVEALPTQDGDQDWRSNLSTIKIQVADCLFADNAAREAEPHLRSALAIREQLFEEQPYNLQVREQLASCLERLLRCCQVQQRLDLAITFADRYLHLSRETLRLAPSQQSLKVSLAGAHFRRAELAELSGDPERALSEWRLAATLLDASYRAQSDGLLWNPDAPMKDQLASTLDRARANINRLQGASVDANLHRPSPESVTVEVSPIRHPRAT